MTDFDATTNKGKEFHRKPEGYLQTEFRRALANPATTPSELASIIDEYTSSLRDKGLIEEAKVVTRQAIERFEGPLTNRDATRPTVATQLRLTLADIMISEGLVYEAERFLGATNTLLLDRPKQATERYAVLNKLAEALILRECFADAQTIADEVLTWTIGTATPEEVRARIVWADVEYVLRRQQTTPAQGTHDYAEISSHINDSLDIIAQLLASSFPEDQSTSAPHLFIQEQVSNLLMIAGLLLHLKAVQTAHACCDEAQNILNLVPTIPGAKRLTLNAMVIRAQLLESGKQYETALQRYRGALHFCETELNAPKSPEGVELRISITEMELEIALQSEEVDLKGLRALDQRFQGSAEELDELFPDAYDALRLIILARRVQICECFMRELGSEAFKRQHHQLLDAFDATAALVNSRNRAE